MEARSLSLLLGNPNGEESRTCSEMTVPYRERDLKVCWNVSTFTSTVLHFLVLHLPPLGRMNMIAGNSKSWDLSWTEVYFTNFTCLPTSVTDNGPETTLTVHVRE